MVMWRNLTLPRKGLLRGLEATVTVWPAATREIKDGWIIDRATGEPRNPDDPTDHDGWDVTQPDAESVLANLHYLSRHDWRLQKYGVLEGDILEFFCDYSYWDTFKTAERIVIDGTDYDVPKNDNAICELRRERDPDGRIRRMRVLTRKVLRSS